MGNFTLVRIFSAGRIGRPLFLCNYVSAYTSCFEIVGAVVTAGPVIGGVTREPVLGSNGYG